MADYVSFNEFIDHTASAKVEHHIETLKAGLAKAKSVDLAVGASMLTHARSLKRVNSDDLEAEFDRMKKFVLKRYEKAKATHSFLDPAGNFIDCIGFDQQQTLITAEAQGHKVLKELPKPAPIVGKKSTAKRPLRPVSPLAAPLSQGAFDPFGNAIQCPEGDIPLRRITLFQFARYGQFERFFRKFPVQTVALTPKTALPAVGAGPDGYVHRHALAQAPSTGSEDYYGCATFLNLWGQDPSPGEMHLSQTWIIGPDPSGASPYPDTVESGWQVNPSAWGTTLPVLFIFFNPDGYGTRSPQGQSRSGYGVNQFHEGFIVYPNTHWIANAAAGGIQSLSTPKGPQKGFAMQWQRDASGNWVLYCGSEMNSLEGVGYFPANLYQNTFLGQSAKLLQFGGEVASKNPSGTGPMGSGVVPTNPATAGYGTVAFQNQIAVQSAVGQSMSPPSLTASTDSPGFYESIAGSSSNSSWGSFFFFGGPSGSL